MLGLRTAIYPVKDLSEGKAWYTKMFGVLPYFDQPFYVGFSVAGFELGLVPDGRPGNLGVTAYWGVEDIDRELERLLSLGARPHEGVQDVGGGIRSASVLDPFGNVIGIIQNPHFDPAAVR